MLLSWKKNVGKLYFLFLISWFQKHLCGKNPFCFSIIFEIIVFNLFSLRLKKKQNFRQKTSFFVFVQSLFVAFFLSTFLFSFITVVFVHFFSSFFCSSLRAFSPIFFSLFSPFFLFLYLSVSLSFFTVSHVSLSVFLHRRFCVSPLLFLISFFFSSFFFTCFFFINVSVFCSNKFNFFLIFELSFLLCFVSCFSSLRHPYSLSLPCFTGFQRFLMFLFLDFLVSIFFSGLVQKFSAWLLDKSCKKKKCLKETLVFLDFNHFCCRFVFSCIIFKNILPLFFFQMSLKNILFLLAQSHCFCSKKNLTQKKLDFLYFMFALLVVTLLILLAFLWFSFFSYHVSLLVFAQVMFVYSLSFVYLLSLSLSYASSVQFFYKNHLHFL